MKQSLTGRSDFITGLPNQFICKKNVSSQVYFIFFFGVIAMLAGCNKKFPVDPGPGHNLPLTIDFTSPNLFPEGLAYDPIRYRFYVSSTSFGQVGTVSPEGSYSPFITDTILKGTTGLKVDNALQRLWVCNVENGIGVYSLANGKRIFYTDLTKVLPNAPAFINDEVLDPEGNAYITNSFFPVIYKVTREGKASVFFQDNAFTTAPGDFGFNGIQYDAKGFLLVAFADQLVKIPLHNPASYSFVKLDAPIIADGLLLSKDGSQLISVNDTGGTPDDKVVSFISNDEWKTGSLSTSYSTGAVFPTSVTSDGKRVFVVYSFLNNGDAGQNTFTIQEVPLQKGSSF
ncbi:MAG: hypothetical protein ABI863_13680 [Ginsengibacter sp.]